VSGKLQIGSRPLGDAEALASGAKTLSQTLPKTLSDFGHFRNKVGDKVRVKGLESGLLGQARISEAAAVDLHALQSVFTQ
jgi:hypothetical protein